MTSSSVRAVAPATRSGIEARVATAPRGGRTAGILPARRICAALASRITVASRIGVACRTAVARRIGRGRFAPAIGLCALLASATPSRADVIHVNAAAAPGGDGLSWATAYDTFDAALTAAQPGDQIWVAAGTYVGNFTLALGVEHYGGFAGTETDLSQRDWNTNVTILDGNRQIFYDVVTAPVGATNATRIDGFTITNGRSRGLYMEDSSPTVANNTVAGNGGGLYLSQSSAVIENNTITGNGASAGAGLYVAHSDALIVNNTITNNRARGEGGGGLYVWGSSPTIANNTIIGNRAESAAVGGGLYLRESSASVANNTITDNIAFYGGGFFLSGANATITNNVISRNRAAVGGAMSIWSFSPMIANNVIAGNSAVQVGGGLHLYSSTPTIVNNTIMGNSAVDDGGGLYLEASSPTIVNSTVVGNKGALSAGGMYLGTGSSPNIVNTIIAFNSSGIDADGGAPMLRNNCIYGNTAYDYAGVSDPVGTDGNISADPLLADWRYGNTHIQADSPCVDAGNNAYAIGDFDMDGEPRIQAGTVDIGADESDGTLWPPGPYAVVRVSPNGNDANDGSSWMLAMRTVQAGIDAAAAVGGEVWVREGTYQECITLHPYAYAYGGFAGVEISRDERDWRRHVTTLDAQQRGPVVSVRAGHGVSAIDGFSIFNGTGTEELISSTFGGGLYVRNASPTIANNTIRGNLAWHGGGLYLWYSSAVIHNNNIIGNISFRQGGGVYLGSSSPVLSNNKITDNTAGDGAGLYISSSFPTIANCTLVANYATADGGGVYLNSSSATITNTVVAFNSSGIHRRLEDSVTPALRHNCVYGNTAYDYNGLADPTGVDGNISTDPDFADLTFGNIHLQPESACVDAGDNADATGDEDMDAQPRIQGASVDIGADESDGTVWPRGPYLTAHVSPMGDDSNDGSSWAQAKRTVQAGIDQASTHGGEVWVQGGTYEGRIMLHPYAYLYGGFAGDEMVRDERDWVANITTLDGQRNGSVVTVQAGQGVSTVDGFTITNGSATVPWSWGAGGGLYLRNCSPTIANTTVTGNIALQFGGGLYVYQSSPIITNNKVTGNSAGWSGGGLYVSRSSATIVNNTIAGNRSDYGGGMDLGWYSSPSIANNTITGNIATSGGGLYLGSSSSATIANTIVAFNSSGISQYDSTDSPTLRYNCVYGNTDYDYDGLPDPTGTDGNISVDPLLAALLCGNTHIQPDSPCVDAGNDADVHGDFDMDGEPRVQPLGGIVDIGADESDGTAWPAAAHFIIRVSPAGDDDNDGSSWPLAKRTVQAAVDAASAVGGEIWVQGGTYEERITLHPYVYVYGGFTGNETTRDQRDWVANVTTLDGKQHGSVVTAQAGHEVSTIDGFTITNGSATVPGSTNGGGIYLWNSSPTIANNTIVGNVADDSGGGLYLFHSSPMIADNNVIANSAASAGGGIFASWCSPMITNNIVTGNGTEESGGGL